MYEGGITFSKKKNIVELILGVSTRIHKTKFSNKAGSVCFFPFFSFLFFIFADSICLVFCPTGMHQRYTIEAQCTQLTIRLFAFHVSFTDVCTREVHSSVFFAFFFSFRLYIRVFKDLVKKKNRGCYPCDSSI